MFYPFFSHLYWFEDGLCILFGHMKNDQEGVRRHPRHVFANPVIPAICPVLSLATYLAIFGFDGSGHLFPGANQYDRYAKILKRALESESMRTEIERSGFESSDFGTHSTRKGAKTYASGSSTAGPSEPSILLRGGWTQPGDQSAYTHFEAAGDNVVGRFLAGLPFDTPEFSTLPPFFETSELCVDDAVDLCFPGCPASMRVACRYFLASLVHHSDYLKRTLPEDHLLYRTTLFSTESLLPTLKAMVVCRRPLPTDIVRSSGIPPHAEIIAGQERQEQRLDRQEQELGHIIHHPGSALAYGWCPRCHGTETRSIAPTRGWTAPLCRRAVPAAKRQRTKRLGAVVLWKCRCEDAADPVHD